jgi:hypothetical protein
MLDLCLLVLCGTERVLMVRYCVAQSVCYGTFEMLGDLNAGIGREHSALWWQHNGR